VRAGRRQPGAEHVRALPGRRLAGADARVPVPHAPRNRGFPLQALLRRQAAQRRRSGGGTLPRGALLQAVPFLRRARGTGALCVQLHRQHGRGGPRSEPAQDAAAALPCGRALRGAADPVQGAEAGVGAPRAEPLWQGCGGFRRRRDSGRLPGARGRCRDLLLRTGGAPGAARLCGRWLVSARGGLPRGRAPPQRRHHARAAQPVGPRPRGHAADQRHLGRADLRRQGARRLSGCAAPLLQAAGGLHPAGPRARTRRGVRGPPRRAAGQAGRALPGGVGARLLQALPRQRQPAAPGQGGAANAGRRTPGAQELRGAQQRRRCGATQEATTGAWARGAARRGGRRRQQGPSPTGE